MPDFGLLNQSFKGMSRRKRIAALELTIRDNPSVGNFEELGELYMEDGKLQQARRRSARQSMRAQRRWIASIGAVYAPFCWAMRRVRCLISKRWSRRSRITTSIAHRLCWRSAYALTGEKEKAEAFFRRVTVTSTLSETYLNFADFLASEGRTAEAREWAQKVLDKEPTMPRYLRRRERPWSQRARKTLKKLPA